jgi:hypothetical protein
MSIFFFLFSFSYFFFFFFFLFLSFFRGVFLHSYAEKKWEGFNQTPRTWTGSTTAPTSTATFSLIFHRGMQIEIATTQDLAESRAHERA